MTAGDSFIVVTGLRLRSPLHAPLFAFHAMRAFAQAQRDPACSFAEARQIDDVHHTVTVWTDAGAAGAYGRSGAHARATAVFAKIATGKVWSGIASEPPGWLEARRLWDEEGRDV